MSDIVINGITYPAPKRVAFPGADGKPVVFDLPEDADAGLNSYSERPVQNKVIYNAITAEAAARAAADEEIHQHLTSPYNFKGSLASAAALPEASAANANDTYYLIAEKYRVTSNGTAWEQSSMEESQYTDELAEVKSAFTDFIANPTWTDGYISTTGAVVDSSNYQYSSPIEINYGRIVVELTDDTIVSVVARYDESNNTYTSLLAGAGTNIHKQYIYDVTTPGKYVISYRKTNGKSEIRIITSPKINSLPGIVDEKTMYSSNIPYKTITGSYIRSDGKYANSDLYAHTHVMALAEGIYHIAAYGTTPVSILTSCDETGNNRTSIIVADGSSSFDYTVSEEGYYIFSYRIEQGLTITRVSSTKEAIKYNDKEINAIKETLGNLIFNSSLLPNYNSGGYVNSYGEIATSLNYSYSFPILIKKGTLKVKCYADNVTAVISKTNAQATAYTPVVLGDGVSTLKTYSYEVTEEGYYCVSFRSASADATVGVELNLYDELTRIENESEDSATSTIKTYKQDTITPNFTIKAFKTLNYSDGTMNKYSQVLWCDETTDTYYLSENVYSEKHQIFTWDSVLAGNNDSSMYQAVILANGDILFVFQTQFKNPTDDTAQGSYRRNPIICSASDGFELSEIDFGNSVKPTGWLQNVGAFYSYTHDRLFIAEYTRANEQYARIWAVDMPVTTVSNWHIILEKEIPTPYQVGFKHFHSCQEDPFTSVLYFSSGDNNVSSAVWYSTDGGNNLTQLDNYDAGKYRMLNMAFTKNYVYWASDQWKPDHFLWRIARNESTGVLDVSTLTKLVTFDDEVVGDVSRIATYTTVFMPCFNCLVMLDRDDSGIHSSVPVRVYDIESGNLYTIAEMTPLSSGVNTGFRNVAVTCYVKSNEIVCSFDKKLLNYNKLLGNNLTSRINNLVLRIYKNGSSYAVDFDTVY